MKVFTIIYLRMTREELLVQAKDQKEAEQRFHANNPDDQIVDVHERSRFEMRHRGECSL